MVDLNLNYTQLGIITGISSTTSGFLQLLWSVLNRYIPRRTLLGVGNVFMSLGSLVTGTANQFMELFGGHIISASGQAAQHPVGTSIVTDKFPDKEASGALSIHYGIGYVGNIISPIILSSIAIIMGWRSAIYFLALIPFITGLTVFFTLRGEPTAEKSIQRKGQSSLLRDIKTAIRLKSVVLIMAAQAFAVGGTGMGVIITYTPLFLKNNLGLGSFETSLIYSIAVAGGVIGTIAFGQLAKRFGNLPTAAAIIGTCSVLIVLLTLHASLSFILIAQLFMIGATSFSSSSLLQAHLASISTPRQRDLLIGLFFTVGFGISSIWTTFTGLLIDTYNSFNPAWIFRAALGSLAFLLIIWASRQNTSDS
jgi:predicted MFS family arabinose efflux permease